MIISGTYVFPLARLSKTRESQTAYLVMNSSRLKFSGTDKRDRKLEVVSDSDSDPGQGSEQPTRLVTCALTACMSLEVSLSV